MSAPPDKPLERMLRNALFLSLAINCLMAIAGTIANLAPSLRWLSWISNGIAAPPGLILRWLIHPKGHSVAAYGLAAAEGLIGAWIFYALLAFGLLWGIKHFSK